MTAPNPKSKLQTPNTAARLRPPQFGLRTLLLVVTACAVLAALSHWLTPMAIAGLVFLIVSVAAHVAGNAIGTRLRELGSQRLPDHELGPSPGSARGRLQADDFAPTTRLSEHRALGWPIFVGTLSGVLAGGCGGGVWTILASPGHVGPLNVALGVAAFAALGGMASFVTFGFVQVACGAIHQALSSAASSAAQSRTSPDKLR